VSATTLAALWMMTAAGEPPPSNVVSLELPSILWGAVELQGERYFASSRWSALVALGAHWAAEEDYSSWSLATGAEVRYWLKRFRPKFMEDVGGPFAGIHLDGALTRTRVRWDGSVLSAGAFDLSIRVGYRFAFLRRVELTPYVGGALDFGLTGTPRFVVGEPRPVLLLGLTAGYMF
jgi:hypothetical protein